MTAVAGYAILLLIAIAGLWALTGWPEQRYEPHHARPELTGPDGETRLARLAAASPDTATQASIRTQLLAERIPAGTPIATTPVTPPAPPSWMDEPDPEPTQAHPHAVNTWGGTAAQTADRLAGEHLTVKQ